MQWQGGQSLTNLWRAAFDVRHGQRLHLGTALDSSEELYLALEKLETHVHIVGPPGTGKSRLLLWIFQLLTNIPKATIILLNPKGALFRQARDFTVQRGQTNRLVLLDPGDPDCVAGYNPLQPNALPIATHAKAVREGIRSAWGQASFDLTPQLARFLYLALVAAREQNLDLSDAARLLRPNSDLRGRVLPLLEDPFIKEALEYFDSLSPRRQDDLVASTLARLEAFVFDLTIIRMLTARPSLDIGDVIAEHKILLANLQLYRPLREDDVKLLGRFLTSDVVNHVFARDEEERTPVYFLIDEAALFTTHDLCNILDLGRELGLHCVFAHQHLNQLRDEDRNNHLFDSVMTCARTKIVFGGLPVKDLEFLAPELFIDQYDPWEVTDELRSLELEPIESTRESITRGGHVDRTLTRGGSFGQGTTRGTSVGEGLTQGTGRTRAVTQIQTRGSTLNWIRGRTKGHTRTESEQSGTSSSSGSGWSCGHSSGSQSGSSVGNTVLPSGEVLSTAFDSSGITAANFSNETGNDTFGESQSSGVADSVHESTHRARQYGTQHSRALGSSRGQEESQSKSLTKGLSEGVSQNREQSKSVGDTRGSTWSRTISPFYEYKKRWVVSSRTFLSKDEFLTLALQKLRALPLGHFLLKVPGHHAVFARAPFVEARKAGPKLLTTALRRVFGQPFYHPVNQSLLPEASSHIEDGHTAKSALQQGTDLVEAKPVAEMKRQDERPAKREKPRKPKKQSPLDQVLEKQISRE